MKKIIFAIIISFLFVIPVIVSADVGVGVNVGKIEIDESLKPGGIYNLPVVGVLNTGDEPGSYEVTITYHQDQPELLPPEEWFVFTPNQFNLEAGGSQNVSITLTVPVKTKPGDYFAYIEAHPVVAAGPGTTVGIAAATKTYFTIAPANIFQAIYYRIASFMRIYAPWTYIILLVIIGAVIITLVRQKFSMQLPIVKKKTSEDDTPDPSETDST